MNEILKSQKFIELYNLLETKNQKDLFEKKVEEIFKKCPNNEYSKYLLPIDPNTNEEILYEDIYFDPTTSMCYTKKEKDTILTNIYNNLYDFFNKNNFQFPHNISELASMFNITVVQKERILYKNLSFKSKVLYKMLKTNLINDDEDLIGLIMYDTEDIVVNCLLNDLIEYDRTNLNKILAYYIFYVNNLDKFIYKSKREYSYLQRKYVYNSYQIDNPQFLFITSIIENIKFLFKFNTLNFLGDNDETKEIVNDNYNTKKLVYFMKNSTYEDVINKIIEIKTCSKNLIFNAFIINTLFYYNTKQFLHIINNFLIYGNDIYLYNIERANNFFLNKK